ncbi:ATP-binding cassette domain-containing protein [Candidatus Peregrinibacteria bacterium]|nr:ATP-binding cassette domain-containing protein [Candidatus Peregrinibacteria bacterium]
MQVISVKSLEKIYANGVRALDCVDFEMKKGDFLGLLGANGAGKTTMISIFTGTVNKTAGSVNIFGIDIDKDHNSAKKKIGVVPQEFNFNIFEKVIDIVVQQAGYFGIPRKKALKNAEKLLKDLGLWSKRNNPAKELSGGMKRRLMIVRALVHDPKLLILDEPTAGVDVELRHSMWEYLKKLNESGVTILLTSHYLEEIEELCNDVVMIKKGKIVIKDTVSHVLKSIDEVTYVIDVDKVKKTFVAHNFVYKIIDENTLEVRITQKHTLNEFLRILDRNGMMISNLRPKSNRLEQLFLNILNA